MPKKIAIGCTRAIRQMSGKPKARLMPFPLTITAHASMLRPKHRARRLGFAGRPWFLASEKRYLTVELAHVRGRWWLAYNGIPCTGGFKTKQQAVSWFVKDGR